MKRLIIPGLIAAVLCSAALQAQQPFHARYEFGLGAGVVLYQGDLTPERLGAAKTMKFAWQLQASKILGPAWALRAQLFRGHLHGDDARYASPEYRQQRNFNFTSPVTELSASLVWNIRGSNDQDKGLVPYVFAGGGLSFLKIKRDWSKINPTFFSPEASSTVWTGLAADSTTTPPRLIPVIPAGAGIKYYLNSHWAVNVESSYRFSYTDYIDGFSQSVNPKKNDHYISYTAGVIYRTGKTDRLRCPKVKY